jgi:Bacterial TSP3 repeat
MKSYHLINNKKGAKRGLATQALGSLAVLAAVGLFAAPVSRVQATTVPNPAEGDVYLAFRADGQPGQGKSYLVKIGQDTLFSSGGYLSVTGLGNIYNDLVDIYGSSWNTRSDLHWSVVGERVLSNGNATVYATRERVSTQVPSTPWPTLNLQARRGTATWIGSVLNGIYGYRGSDATANSSVAASQDAFYERYSNYARQTDTKSRNGEDGASVPITAGTSQFGGFSQWDQKSGGIEGDFTNGAAATALDFYRFDASGVTRLGTFSLDDSGNLTFALLSEISSTQDTDGDGVSDLDEISAGTDPNDSKDFLRVNSFTVTSSGPEVVATTVANKAYHVEYSEDLVTWTPIAYHAAGPDATPLDFVDTDAARKSKAKGFYRLKVVP